MLNIPLSVFARHVSSFPLKIYLGEECYLEMRLSVLTKKCGCIYLHTRKTLCFVVEYFEALYPMQPLLLLYPLLQILAVFVYPWTIFSS